MEGIISPIALGKMLEKQSMLLYHNIKGALKTKLELQSDTCLFLAY